MAQSLYRQASLIMNPYGAKDDLLPSIKPTDGSGDFTFSRDGAGASPATRVNASGLIEKGRENLLDYSNDFSNWTLASVTPTSGQSGYDGSSDAWELNKTNTGGAIINPTTLNGVATCSVYAKAGTLDFVLFYINYNSGTDTQAYFDLSTGSVGTTIAAIDSNITSLGSGWYRCDVSFNCPSTLADVRIFPAIADNDSTGTGTIYIQDAQLESGLVATDYIETTTAPVSAGLLGDMPRLDYSGGATCPSLLLEPSRVNVLSQSEYFGTTPYSRVNVSVTHNDLLSPEGVLNAAKLISSGGASRIETFPTLSDNTTYTASIFAKRGDVNFIMISVLKKDNSQDKVFFNLLEGTKGTTSGSPISSSIEAVGDYYRVTLTINSSSGGTTPRLQYLIANTDNNVVTASGEYIYVYGAQLESGSYPTSYIPTYGSASTRNRDDISVGSLSTNGLTSATAWTFIVKGDWNGNGAAGNNFVLSRDEGGFMYRYGGSMGFSGATTGYWTEYNPTASTAFIWDGTQLRIRRGGSDIKTRSASLIGWNAGGTGNWSLSFISLTRLNYEIDQLLLFNQVLTDAEIDALTA